MSNEGALMECVPNFSEGRRQAVIDRIVSAIADGSEVAVLDVSSDADHNRTVVTFVGTPEAVAEAAFQGIKVAAQLIDLEQHTGEHPRIGATDVCPIVPVRGVTMDECVAVARRLAQRVGEDLGIATYLYGAAAQMPEREKLSAIRRGQYEGWRDSVATDASRRPDYGPALPRSWGATVIGARPFLIAYNIYLSTDDKAVADRIARRVRASSGGLQNVQALGFMVDGQAQVSMNLTDFETTSIFEVQELVKQEAAASGTVISHAELVGLVPQKALVDSARLYLQLRDMTPDQVLEVKMASLPAGESIREFLHRTGQGRATPGGGAAAALVGALAAALAQMMAALTQGRKRYLAFADEASAIESEAARLRLQLTKAITGDSAAFEALMAVFRDGSLGDRKAAAIEAATRHAGEVPLQVAHHCVAAARLAERIVAVGNRNAITDGAAGAVLAQAAAEVAGMNVRINATSLNDRALAQAWSVEVEEITDEIRGIVTRVRAHVDAEIAG